MALLDVGKLVTQMLVAAKKSLAGGGAKVALYARTEFPKIAQTIVLIETGVGEKTISEAEAKILLDMQTNASRAVLAAVEGMSAIAAEQAINAALTAIKDAVNKALPFALL